MQVPCLDLRVGGPVRRFTHAEHATSVEADLRDQRMVRQDKTAKAVPVLRQEGRFIGSWNPTLGLPRKYRFLIRFNASKQTAVDLAIQCHRPGACHWAAKNHFLMATRSATWTFARTA